MGYLRFLGQALQTHSTVEAPGVAPLRLEIELTHTLKANTYLLLYNTVEAVMGQLLAEIHDEVKTNHLSLDELSPTLYLQVLRALKNGKENIDNDFAHPSGHTIVAYWLRDYEKRVKDNRNPHFSGNIDGKRIKEIGLKYGFASGDPTADAKLSHTALRTTKSNRNALAHGERSFADLGRGLAYPQIACDATATLRTLSTIRWVVDDFLACAGYRRNP